MFLLNVGYKWNFAREFDNCHGIVILPSYNHSERLKNAGNVDFQRVLLDPQVYLAQLDEAECTKTCAKLSSYKWFNNGDAPTFGEEGQKISDWIKLLEDYTEENWVGSVPEEDDEIINLCNEAIQFQARNGCTHIILPMPLITEREDEAEIQANWLDICLKILDEDDIAQPALATIAIDEAVLNETVFDSAGFLDTIIDQIASRSTEQTDGVYIVVSQTHANHPFKTNEIVNKAYLYLTRAANESGFNNIIINFADVFGSVCAASGANSFATGQSQSIRRLSHEGFLDRGGGIALPHLYTHNVIAELRSETDLNEIQSHGMLEILDGRTPYSDVLLSKLVSGGSASEIGSWAESQNNCTAANKHFLYTINSVGKLINKLEGEEVQQRFIKKWLINALAYQLLIMNKVGDDGIAGNIAPSAEWLDTFNKTMSQ